MSDSDSDVDYLPPRWALSDSALPLDKWRARRHSTAKLWWPQAVTKSLKLMRVELSAKEIPGPANSQPDSTTYNKMGSLFEQPRNAGTLCMLSQYIARNTKLMVNSSWWPEN